MSLSTIGSPDSFKSLRGVQSLNERAAEQIDSAPLHPACVQCSKAWAAKHTDALPATVPVEKALILRPTPARGYLAIVECRHGGQVVKKEVVELGLETPTDNQIRSARAFT